MSGDELSIHMAAKEHGRALALIDGDRRTSWDELRDEVSSRAEELAPHIDPSESKRIAVLGEPTRARIIDVLAAIELGAPLVMLHPRWTEVERHAVLSETKPCLVLGKDVIAHIGSGPLSQNTTDASAPLAILYTSGTTGPAKGAILSRRAFIASARASAVHLPLTPSDRWLLTMPLAHVGGLSIVIRSLIARSAIVIGGPFEAERTRALIARENPTLISLVPTMLSRLLDAGFTRSHGLRAILLGGAACPDRVLERARAHDLPIRTTYGLTEACSQVTTALSNVTSSEDGSGIPLPGIEIRIGPSEHIEVRGPTMFDGWFPKGAHDSPFDHDGFYDTGDLGFFDSEGRLHVLARRSDLIVTGGENVYPIDIENALMKLPEVRAACVFGLPDPHWGQLVAAAIVLEREVRDEDLKKSLSRSLARFKVPKHFMRLPALVMGPTGKLDRRATALLASSALIDPEEPRE